MSNHKRKSSHLRRTFHTIQLQFFVEKLMPRLGQLNFYKQIQRKTQKIPSNVFSTFMHLIAGVEFLLDIVSLSASWLNPYPHHPGRGQLRILWEFTGSGSVNRGHNAPTSNKWHLSKGYLITHRTPTARSPQYEKWLKHLLFTFMVYIYHFTSKQPNFHLSVWFFWFAWSAKCQSFNYI